MATLDEQIKQSVESVNADTKILHDIVHGTDTQSIDTDNGKVDAIAKVIKDNKANIQSSISELTAIKTDVTTAKDEVLESKSEIDQLKIAFDNLANRVGDNIGMITSFMTETAPNGFLRCDGTEFPESLYPELYAALPAHLKNESTKNKY